jgi:hypothetical protein
VGRLAACGRWSRRCSTSRSTGFLAGEGTDFWDFCFSLPENDRPDDEAQLEFPRSAHAHVFGRTAYEGIAPAMANNPDHPSRRS